MSKFIYIPQLPIKNRYPEFWITELVKNFRNNYEEVIILGEKYINNFLKNDDRNMEMFSGINSSINFELCQISEYIELNINKKDTIFMQDLSFPGLFSNVLYHKNSDNMFCYLHATSKNNYDYFKEVRYSKYPCEVANSKLFKKIFVGSNYHKNKLKWNNIMVLGVPSPPFECFEEEKKYNIISASRPSIQKINKSLEKRIEKDFGKIIRKETNSWNEYYKFLSNGKIVLLSGKEETFGYQVLEAVLNKSVPLVPNNFSYPELLESDYLYSSYEELKDKINKVLDGQLNPPEKLKNQDLVDGFYKNLIDEMKGL